MTTDATKDRFLSIRSTSWESTLRGFEGRRFRLSLGIRLDVLGFRTSLKGRAPR